jgi:cysteine desulfurase
MSRASHIPMQQRTRVYFDHAATTPLLEAARSAMQPHLADGGNALCGNASSPYEAGRTARMAIDRARTQVAALIGANADEVVFTGGGTESDNWALLGVALRNLERRGHVIISAIEHHAVLEPAETLRDLGFAVDTARVGATEYSMPPKSRVCYIPIRCWFRLWRLTTKSARCNRLKTSES